jgi:hypothetical protein
LAVIAVAGCGQALPPLTHPAFSQPQWEHDDAECSRNATLVSGGGWTPFGRGETENQVYYRCMVVRGYRPTIPGLSSSTPRRGAPRIEETLPTSQPGEPGRSLTPGEVADSRDDTEVPSEAADSPAEVAPVEPDDVDDSVESPDDPMESPDVADPADLEPPSDLPPPAEPTAPEDAIEPAPVEEGVEPESPEDLIEEREPDPSDGAADEGADTGR